MAQQFKIGDKAPQGLYLRSAPIVKDGTRITILPMGQSVTKIAQSPVAGWWEITTTVDNTLLTGFVNSTYLVSVADFVAPAPAKTISAVHLKNTGKVTRGSEGPRAFPLNEQGMKTRKASPGDLARRGELTAIIEWLDVENQKRYKPTSVNTFCNIYAYDYCYLAGAYLPRVWWTQEALNQLQKGAPVSPIYGETVNELNANSLYVWLKQYGQLFGWRRTFDLTEMQNAANDGLVVIICAQNKLLNRSGHICPVVPEKKPDTAVWNNGVVKNPLQSQAGRVNKKYFASNWWNTSTFREFGFWINIL